MKKAVLTIILVLSMLSLVILPCAATKPEEEKQGFYASSAEQDAIYELLQQDSFDFKKSLELRSLTVVKESIAPVYTVDLLDYAETGVFKIVPTNGEYRPASTPSNSKFYVAKLVTASGEYGGKIIFSIEDDGVARFSDFSPATASAGKGYQASCSYADHALRIKYILDTKDFVSQYDVKYVNLGYMGDFFYIETDGKEYLIPIGKAMPDDGTFVSAETINRILSFEELKSIADEYWQAEEERRIFVETWKKEHPGEEMPAFTGGYNPPSIASTCSRVDNILNISEYLSKGYQPEPSALQIVLVICGAVVLCGGVVGGVMILKSRKKHQQG